MNPLLKIILILCFTNTIFSQTDSSSIQKPSHNNIQHFLYEDSCGSPLTESDLWEVIQGKVINVKDGNTITIVQEDRNTKEILLAAIKLPPEGNSYRDSAKQMLNNLVMNKKINILVNPSVLHKNQEPEINEYTGIVYVNKKEVNLILLKLGYVFYIEPKAYTISNYTNCVYQIEERKAKRAKSGLWKVLN